MNFPNRARVAVVLVPVLLAAGCGGGEDAPLKIGVNKYGVDLAFTDDQLKKLADTQIPAVPNSDFAGLARLRLGSLRDFLGDVEEEQRRIERRFPDRHCPTARPDDVPGKPADGLIARPPEQGVYGYHNTGTYTVTVGGGAAGESLPMSGTFPYPARTLREVRDVAFFDPATGSDEAAFARDSSGAPVPNPPDVTVPRTQVPVVGGTVDPTGSENPFQPFRFSVTTAIVPQVPTKVLFNVTTTANLPESTQSVGGMRYERISYSNPRAGDLDLAPYPQVRLADNPIVPTPQDTRQATEVQVDDQVGTGSLPGGRPGVTVTVPPTVPRRPGEEIVAPPAEAANDASKEQQRNTTDGTPTEGMEVDALETRQVDQGTDADGTVMTTQRRVLHKERVDACGTLIDTFRSSNIETITSAEGVSMVTNAIYNIAPQFGGIIARYQVHTTFNFNAELGGVTLPVRVETTYTSTLDDDSPIGP